MIWEELNPNLVFTDVEAKSSKDVFEKVGGAMIKEGYAKDTYVQALINRESEFPTGLDMGGFGIAIPHTNVEYVNKAATAIAVLKDPVSFHVMGGDDEDTVDVNLAFMLAVDDPNAHIDKLQRIVDLIQDQDFLRELSEQKEGSEIIELIKNKEQSL